MHFDLASEFEPGDAPQILAQNLLLDFELMLVGGVLMVASAATSEIRTLRLHAVRRRLYDGCWPRAGEARFFFGERGFDFLSGKNEGDEYGFAAATIVGGKASESVAAVDELFND
jgi:hypothetical protein